MTTFHPAPSIASPPPVAPAEQLTALCDPGSVQVIRSAVRSPSMGDRAQADDGIVAASATIAGRPVFCFAEDGRFAGGSLGEAHAGTILRVLELAAKAQVPVVSFVASAGARLQEGLAALAGYGRVFRANVALSGRVPQISIVTGTAAGGGCYSPALTDFVLMTEAARMFLTGPRVVEQVTGETIDATKLGSRRVHERNGVCHLVARSDHDAAALARRLLSYLPQNCWEAPPLVASVPASTEDPGSAVPQEHFRSYDVRMALGGIVDDGSLLELNPRWAQNVLTAFARLEGRAIGVVANQPKRLGGVLDAAAGQKAARFVRTCQAFGLPIVVLVDTPGFMPGLQAEAGGIIRHGAKLLHAFAEATVPKLTVVLRQAYGGGYIAMNSKGLGADFVYAWPNAKIGVMGARQAVDVIHRRAIAGADSPEEERHRLAESYTREHQSAPVAARDGAIDEIIEPIETRRRLAGALMALSGKRGALGATTNIPL